MTLKHPALTRALAVVLAVLCLVTLIAGVGSLWKLHGDHGTFLRQQQLLRDRTERAESLLQSLQEREKAYSTASDDLAGRQDAHEKAVSDYRGRLATYTATRAGVKMGREALEKASNLLWRGKKQFEDGYAQFEQGAAAFAEIYQAYTQAKSGVQRGWDTYNRAMSFLESEEGEALVSQLTPEEILAAVTATKNGIRALENVLENADDPAAGSSAAADLQSVSDLLNNIGSEIGDVDPQALARRAVEQIIAQADAAVQAQIDAGASEAEAYAAADAVAQAALGMSYSEAKAWLQQNAETAGGQSSGSALANISPEQAAAMLASLDGESDALQEALAVLREEEKALDEQEAALRADPEAMSNQEALLALLKAELDSSQKIFNIVSRVMESVKKQMDALAVQMEQARKAIEDGITQVGRNRLKLANTAEDLDRQRDEMLLEKRRLQLEQRHLDYHQKVVDEYEENEKDLRSARAVLMKYEGIREAVGSGGDLIESARAELERMTGQQRTETIRRAATGAVMLLAAVTGCLCVAGVFEKPKMKRLWLPTAATALIASAGEAGSLMIGRGVWYSALGLLIAALGLLPLVIQKKQT